MSLPVPNLDDRTFQDLVDEAKRKIPQLCPEWTNHNLSDPGVALIELFAWMTEISLYQLNRVPEAFYTRMLNLLGVDQFPARAAQADVTFWLSGTPTEVTVPAGTEVSTSNASGEAVVFSTIDDIVITQPTLIAALTSSEPNQYQDVWEQLSLGLESVVCFPRQPVAPGDCFYLGFEDSLAGRVVRLDVRASAEGIGVVPDRPPLVWEAWQGEGWAKVEIPTLPGEKHPADTTGGLNRDGSITLMVPAEHEPMTLGGQRAYWLRAKLVNPERDQPMYRTSPRLRHLDAVTIGGTARAEHSVVVDEEVLGTSSGKPGQSFTTDRRPVLARSEGETLVVSDHGESVEWTEVGDFIDSTGDDEHFMWDSTTGEITLGPLVRQPNGTARQYGAIPPDGAVLRISRYRTGGGAVGNVGTHSINNLLSTIPYITGATNLVPAAGGVDGEPVDNAKIRGPQSIRAGGRAVTVSDFERLATEADSGIFRVRCLPPVELGQPIRLLVVPKVERPAESLHIDDFVLPNDMVRRIGDYLDERRVLGSKIEVGVPYYQGVTVAALLTARPGRLPETVKERALRTLYDYVHPITGGPDGTGWPFEVDLNSSLIMQVLDAVEGVEKVEEVLLFSYDLRNQQRLEFGKEVLRLEPDSLFLSASHQVVVR